MAPLSLYLSIAIWIVLQRLLNPGILLSKLKGLTSWPSGVRQYPLLVFLAISTPTIKLSLLILAFCDTLNIGSIRLSPFPLLATISQLALSVFGERSIAFFIFHNYNIASSAVMNNPR